MKTIIKILIALAIVNAVARVGIATAKYYQLKDACQELVTFGAQASPNEIENRVIQKAADLSVPLNPDDVNVSREGFRTTVAAAYTHQVEVFPNYTYPIKFHFSVDALNMAGLGNATPGQSKP